MTPSEVVCTPSAPATVSAAEIGASLANQGRVSFYGIYFDFDKYTVKPEFDAVVADHGKFLAANPNVIGVVQTSPDARYEHMIQVLDGIQAAGATRFAIKVSDGSEKWSFPLADAYSVNPPTYANGRVYFQRGNHSGDTHLWCLDAATGTLKFAAPHSAQWERYAVPVDCLAVMKKRRLMLAAFASAYARVRYRYRVHADNVAVQRWVCGHIFRPTIPTLAPGFGRE